MILVMFDGLLRYDIKTKTMKVKVIRIKHGFYMIALMKIMHNSTLSKKNIVNNMINLQGMI